jgi:hypothetical protein
MRLLQKTSLLETLFGFRKISNKRQSAVREWIGSPWRGLFLRQVIEIDSRFAATEFLQSVEVGYSADLEGDLEEGEGGLPSILQFNTDHLVGRQPLGARMECGCGRVP